MKKTHSYLVTLLVLLSSFSMKAQDSTNNETAKNTVYGELAGKGFYYSINYERLLFNINEKLSANASIGFCVIDGSTSSVQPTTDKTFPFELNLRYNLNKNHNIVFGYGFTKWKYSIVYIPINSSNINQQPVAPELKEIKETFSHLTLDYRFQKPEGGLMLKGGITPLYFAAYENSAFTKKSNKQLSMNIAIGYVF